jgi:hypothetical protein
MRILLLLLSSLYSLSSLSFNECNKVAAGYENRDIMYVVCKDLSSISKDAASDLIINLFNQYKGPPDEIAIFFVASPDLIGKTNPEGRELTGFYYSHSNKLEIWPNSINNKKEIEITWK